jgi:hypothetical protein
MMFPVRTTVTHIFHRDTSKSSIIVCSWTNCVVNVIFQVLTAGWQIVGFTGNLYTLIFIC